MGQEIKCRVDYGKQTSEGKALLETSEVLFRGGFRLKIPFQSITALDATPATLTITFADGSAIFHIGAAAEKWAAKIRNPPSRVDKLGVKPALKVQLIGKHDEDFRTELTARGALIVKSKPDLVFLRVQEKEGLLELAYMTKAPVWVIYPKGQKTITEMDVITAGRAAGLLDSKVASFSATHTALRFKMRR